MIICKIQQKYNNLDNYKIEEINGGGRYCWIFFTSHGLYFPTTIAQFEKQVIINDKYEWLNISNNVEIKAKASKYIFVRDIYKNWCLEGINANVNSIEKLAELLKKEAQGKPIITVGSSAGGYMAIALGCILKATYIYAFSPQISLIEYDKFHVVKYLEQYRIDERKKWLSLEEIIGKYRDGDIFYFYPTRCDEDVAQYNIIRNIFNKKLHVFAVRFAQHGTPIYGESVRKTLSIEPDRLVTLCERYNQKEISRMKYMADTSGLAKACIIGIGSFTKKILKRIKSVIFERQVNRN